MYKLEYINFSRRYGILHLQPTKTILCLCDFENTKSPNLSPFSNSLKSFMILDNLYVPKINFLRVKEGTSRRREKLKDEDCNIELHNKK